MAVVSSSNFYSLILQQAFHTTCWLPMEFHIVYFPSFVDKSICVNTRTIHVPVVCRNTNIIKDESEHVQTFRMVREEVEDPPVLLNVGFWVGFQSVHHIREFHAITDKEYRKIVSYQVKVTLQST